MNKLFKQLTKRSEHHQKSGNDARADKSTHFGIPLKCGNIKHFQVKFVGTNNNQPTVNLCIR